MFTHNGHSQNSSEGPPEIVEIAFKAGRIGIYANEPKLPLKIEDLVVVEADKGNDLGRIIQTGQTFSYPGYDNGNGSDEKLKKVVRVATEEDLQKLNGNREEEENAVRLCKEKIVKHRLLMNLVDAEYQWDRNKLTFYFTSEQRVDFRKLVRDLASKFRTRIELRQVGVRDAAKHIQGYGACGCQLCCTVFLKKFENITTQYIKDQLIQTNPTRLTGVCGRLKCCLAFERDFYLDEMAKYPTAGQTIDTPNGKGRVEKVDIFNGVVYVNIGDGGIEKFKFEQLQEMAAS